MHSHSFCVKEFEGINFAKLSGDNNVIHLNKLAGYNSIYGQNIAHGVLVILKFLDKMQFNKNHLRVKLPHC